MVDENKEAVVKGTDVFRLVKNGTNVGILLDCQTEEAAQIAYDQILQSCRENGGVNITVQGQPNTTPLVFEKGINYSDDR